MCMSSPLVCMAVAHSLLLISCLRGMSMYCGQQRGSVWRRVSRDSGVNRWARLRGMKEGCKEALRETRCLSPALCNCDCLYIQPCTQKNTKWLLASFTAKVEAWARKQNKHRDRTTDVAGNFFVALKDSQCFSSLASDCELLSMVLNWQHFFWENNILSAGAALRTAQLVDMELSTVLKAQRSLPERYSALSVGRTWDIWRWL